MCESDQQPESSTDDEDQESPSTGGLPLSLAIVLLLAGIVFGVIPLGT